MNKPLFEGNNSSIVFNVIFLVEQRMFAIILPEEYYCLCNDYYADYDTYKNQLIVNINYNNFRIPGIKSMIDYMTDKQINNMSDSIFMLEKFIEHRFIYNKSLSGSDPEHCFIDYISTMDTVKTTSMRKKIVENNLFRLLHAYRHNPDYILLDGKVLDFSKIYMLYPTEADNDFNHFYNSTSEENNIFINAFSEQNYSITGDIRQDTENYMLDHYRYPNIKKLQDMLVKVVARVLKKIYLNYKEYDDDTYYETKRIIWKKYLDTTGHKTYYNNKENIGDTNIKVYFEYFESYYVGNLIMIDNQIMEALAEAKENNLDIIISLPYTDDLNPSDPIYTINNMKYFKESSTRSSYIIDKDIQTMGIVEFKNEELDNVNISNLESGPREIIISNKFKDSLFLYKKFDYEIGDPNEKILKLNEKYEETPENGYNMHNLIIDSYLESGGKYRNFVLADRNLMKYNSELLRDDAKPSGIGLNTVNKGIISYADLYSYAKFLRKNINIYRLSSSPFGDLGLIKQKKFLLPVNLENARCFPQIMRIRII